MFTQILKCGRVGAVVLAAAVFSVAQYGGGGGMGGTGNGTYTPGSRSYGHGAAIGAAVGAGVGGAVLFLALRHHHRQVVGCVAPDGKTLNADNGKASFQLSGEPMTGGEHVAVLGKKIKSDSGAEELQVLSVKKHLGQCGQQQALATQNP